MSEKTSFSCDECQRTLPAWMEHEEIGVCAQCADENEFSGSDDSSQLEASTKTDEETDTDTVSESLLATPTDGSTTSEDRTGGKNATDETQSDTSTGGHILDPMWDTTIDTSDIENATEETSRSETKSGTDADPLDRKIDSWKQQLLDLTRRSNLVNFSATKTKSLPFHRANPLTVADSLFERNPLYIRRSKKEEEGGSPADPADLKSDEVSSIRANGATENSLNNIRLHGKRFLRERGVDSLFLALGTLRWYDVDHSDSELRTPLFLVQVTLSEETNRNPERHDYEITSEDAEIQVNPALRKLLSAERGIQLSPDKAFSIGELETAFAYIEDVISGFDRWRIAPEVILGIFDFSKFGLYTDLEENRDAIKSDPLVEAINGDPSALPEPAPSPGASQLDSQVPPADTYQVLDADSSQQEAIEAAKRGVSFVLQGPPGTGKSQTISNIIAEKMAAGETVLFVSEKQAALNVVKDRLDNNDLGRFCLEAHGEKASKKQVLEDLSRELTADPLQHPSERSAAMTKLEDTRRTLNQYKEKLFYQPPEQDITPYEAFGIVSKRDTYPRIDSSFGDPTSYSQSEIQSLEEQLASLASYEHEFNRDGNHLWQYATIESWRIDTSESVEATLRDTATAIENLQEIRTDAEAVLGTSLSSISDLRDASELIDLLADVPEVELSERHLEKEFYARRDRLQELATHSQEIAEARSELIKHYDDSFFSTNASELNSELSKYGILRYVSPSYRRLKKQILSHAVEDYSPTIKDLRADTKRLMEINALTEELNEYDGLTSQLGHLYDGHTSDWDTIVAIQEWVATVANNDLVDTEELNDLVLESEEVEIQRFNDRLTKAIVRWENTIPDLEEIFDLSKVHINGTTIDTAVLEEVSAWIEERQHNVDALQSWIQYKAKRNEVLDGAAGRFLKIYLAEDRAASDLVDTFKRNFYTEWLNAVYAETGLDSFSATEYNDLVDEFRQLDQQQREYAKAEIQHRVTNRRPQMELQHAGSSEQVTLRREVQKSRRHMPLRELFEEASTLITKLKPCFMMSPLSVAQYVRHGSIKFDTVIFDEASQIMPQDAISSIIRGEQVIVAGDSKQLPPTSFFQTDVENADGVREDLESILDEASTVLPEKQLLWHYRSRTNELIEFSNAKYYNGALRTFPDNNTSDAMGVDFEYVEDGLYDRGGSSTNQPEADRVLELIQQHIKERPGKSLGIVAFSSKQAQAIRDTIEEVRDQNPELDAFVAEDDALEGFFVKPLENVQGDERDVLIFSIGYGPDEAGKISMNFGPLNQTGGARRLNVAITRAKEYIQVVSSLQPGDIDLQRTDKGGVEDFKHYLEYAKHGENALTRSDSESQFLQFDSEFEEAVYTALEKRGLDVSTQVQSSGYSIDLAIRHPEKPGKYVLGIECDGAAYHSSKTARDRDRTRQAVLEDLGWNIHRIWSPDWASNKSREIDTIESKVADLVEGNITADGGTAVGEIQKIEVDIIPEDERGGIQDHITEWQEPQVATRGDKSLNEVPNEHIGNGLVSVVDKFGPEPREKIFRTTISRWNISRLGKNIRKRLIGFLGSLSRENSVYTQDGFVWPGERPGSIEVRTNSETASRSADEIPLEELAKAGYLILKAGNRMTREDLVLEIARLYNYQRTGSNIKNRINDAVDVLIDEGGAQLDETGNRIGFVDTDIDQQLLNRIYR
ncbi:DUF4011 domain-containing protein [Haloferax sp. AS1]|uniref:DUF4011 domain-containing protein n=1 Tax=Haloferax sp. AS1 TaxID=2562277 RepID=UPI00165EF438|nr:DUF4011 domain-containing protein [Haloferax sp. AS1]MBC9987939.1 DUF4011 domain-containing protein [Haloferax sp. AS1]